MADVKIKAMTKSQLLAALAESSELNKKQVGAVLDALAALATSQLGKKGPGVLTIPGMMKLASKVKPASKAKMGRNPQNGEPMMIKAKKASTVIRARILKVFRESVKL